MTIKIRIVSPPLGKERSTEAILRFVEESKIDTENNYRECGVRIYRPANNNLKTGLAMSARRFKDN